MIIVCPKGAKRREAGRQEGEVSKSGRKARRRRKERRAEEKRPEGLAGVRVRVCSSASPPARSTMNCQLDGRTDGAHFSLPWI